MMIRAALAAVVTIYITVTAASLLSGASWREALTWPRELWGR